MPVNGTGRISLEGLKSYLPGNGNIYNDTLFHGKRLQNILSAHWGNSGDTLPNSNRGTPYLIHEGLLRFSKISKVSPDLHTLFLYLTFGITTTLTFWAALIKATRQTAGTKSQGKAFGVLEGEGGSSQPCFHWDRF